MTDLPLTERLLRRLEALQDTLREAHVEDVGADGVLADARAEVSGCIDLVEQLATVLEDAGVAA